MTNQRILGLAEVGSYRTVAIGVLSDLQHQMDEVVKVAPNGSKETIIKAIELINYCRVMAFRANPEPVQVDGRLVPIDNNPTGGSGW